jgi:hypothetical protein
MVGYALARPARWPCAGGALCGLSAACLLMLSGAIMRANLSQIVVLFDPVGRLNGFVLTDKSAGSLGELRLRSDLQLVHDELTLSCDEIAAAAQLAGNLLVGFSPGKASQQLPLLRRQTVFFGWKAQVTSPIRSSRKVTFFAREDQRPSPAAACRRRVVMARCRDALRYRSPVRAVTITSRHRDEAVTASSRSRTQHNVPERTGPMMLGHGEGNVNGAACIHADAVAVVVGRDDAMRAKRLRCPHYAQKRTSGLAFSTSALCH